MLLSTVASYGDVIIASNSVWTNSAPTDKVQERAIDYAESLNEDKTSPLYHRLDLDKVAPNNPVYIRAPWGYWPNAMPLYSSANSAALRAAGIDRSTPSPSRLVTIEKDAASGEPTGVFVEQTLEPIVEFTLMACAPNFTIEQRAQALRYSMRAYNAVGTTSVFEGHGISSDVMAAYQLARNAGDTSSSASSDSTQGRVVRSTAAFFVSR